MKKKEHGVSLLAGQKQVVGGPGPWALGVCPPDSVCSKGAGVLAPRILGWLWLTMSHPCLSSQLRGEREERRGPAGPPQSLFLAPPTPAWHRLSRRFSSRSLALEDPGLVLVGSEPLFGAKRLAGGSCRAPFPQARPVCLGWTPEAWGLPLSGMSSVPDLVPRLLGCSASSVFGSQSFLPGILLTSWNVLPAAPDAPPSLSSPSSAITPGSHFWVFPVFSVAGPLRVQPCGL